MFFSRVAQSPPARRIHFFWSVLVLMPAVTMNASWYLPAKTILVSTQADEQNPQQNAIMQSRLKPFCIVYSRRFTFAEHCSHNWPTSLLLKDKRYEQPMKTVRPFCFLCGRPVISIIRGIRFVAMIALLLYECHCWSVAPPLLTEISQELLDGSHWIWNKYPQCQKEEQEQEMIQYMKSNCVCHRQLNCCQQKHIYLILILMLIISSFWTSFTTTHNLFPLFFSSSIFFVYCIVGE